MCGEEWGEQDAWPQSSKKIQTFETITTQLNLTTSERPNIIG